jgi:CBS-domain-containing membrane protein
MTAPSSPNAAAVPWPTLVKAALLAGAGGGLVIYLLAQAQAWTSLALLAPAFGASCVLVFVLPDSPLAQPRNVIGGHLVSTAMGLLTFAVLGHSPLSLGVGVGLAIVAMVLTRTLHPPAGGNPIVVILTAAPLSFLFKPMLLGTLAIVLIGGLYHRFVTRRPWPLSRLSSSLARSNQ